MAIYESASGALDVFDEAYWGRLDKASQEETEPLRRYEKVYITDGRTLDQTVLELESLDEAGRDPDFVLPPGEAILAYIMSPEFKNSLVKFDWERMVVIGNQDIKLANAIAEAWKVYQPGLLSITHKPRAHGFYESKHDLHWAYRSESLSGVGIILPTTAHDIQSIFGIRREVTHLPEKWKAFGSPGNTAAVHEAARDETSHTFVALHLPTQLPAYLGQSSKNSFNLSPQESPQPQIITLERIKRLEFFK